MTNHNGGVELGLLPQCTVRIDVGGRPNGSGFFVVPGVVVTCAHVIESQRLTSGEVDPRIEVVTLSGVRHSVQVKQVWPKEQGDIALLQLAAASSDPCVLLAPGLEARDPLHSFGYPELHPEGVPTTLDAEGYTGGEKLIKFKDGQVRGGMSGSPVYNVRTGAVCAVVKLSTDPRQALGGYGIQIATVLQLDGTLQTGNQRYHVADRQWIDLLPTRQRNLLRSIGARPSQTDPSRVFVVSIGQMADDWGVRAELDGTAVTRQPVKVDFYTVREQVARLFRDWASRGRVDPATQIRLLGEILYRAAFPSEVGERFQELLAQRKEEPLLVAVRFEARTHLVTLPWEHLFVPQGERVGIHIAADPSLTFVRSQEKQPAEEQPAERRELSALVVGLTPKQSNDDDGVFDATQIDKVVFELQRQTSALSGLVLETVETENAVAHDPLKLADKINNDDYQVIHVVAFGRFRDRGDELVSPITFDRLVAGLQGGSPKLVVLQLLEAEHQAVAADFALLAPSLVAQSVPAVLAFQYPVKADAATRFNLALYTHLAAGTSIDVAVQRARNSALILEPSSRAFVAPALFVERPGTIRLAPLPSVGARQERIGAWAS